MGQGPPAGRPAPGQRGRESKRARRHGRRVLACRPRPLPTLSHAGQLAPPLPSTCGSTQPPTPPPPPPGVDTTLDPLPYAIARWVIGGWPSVEAAGRLFNTLTVKDKWGRPVLLFKNAFALQQVEAEAGGKLGALSPFALPPDS
jgi:hypothetical protein